MTVKLVVQKAHLMRCRQSVSYSGTKKYDISKCLNLSNISEILCYLTQEIILSNSFR